MTTHEIQWRRLDASDLPRVAELSGRCFAHDGGHPAAAEPAFVAGRYADAGGRAWGGWLDGVLVASAAVRPQETGDGRRVTATGQVDPHVRGRGYGAHLLDWSLDNAADIGGELLVETESLTPASRELFTSRGLRQVFAERVMRFDLHRTALPAVPVPPGVRFEPWTEETRPRFFAAYEASFRTRPGFPGWSAEQWLDWLVDDDFRPQWSLLAVRRDTGVVEGDAGGVDGAAGGPPGRGRASGAAGAAEDIGFVVTSDGWIVQIGVVPEYRGQGIGAALVVAALEKMRAAGATEALLDVHVDNPAGDLYRRLGFALLGIRARFAFPSPTG